MFSMLRNERGGVFIYVLLIVMLLAVFTPVILNNISSAQQQDILYEFEETARQLAVSSLEAFLSVPEAERVGYLSQHYFTDNPVVMSVPGSGNVHYYQYVVAINDSNDISNAVDSIAVNLEDQRVVITAISGDSNGNMEKDLGERYFKMTQLTKVFEQPEAIEKTEKPTVSPLLRDGHTTINGTAEPNSQISITVNELNTENEEILVNVYFGNAGGAGGFSISPVTLIDGYIVYVYAKSTDKLISDSFRTIVQPGSVGDNGGNNDGLVIIRDEDGNETYVPFQDVDSTEDDLIVTEGFNGPYSTTSTIDLTAKSIEIEPGVNITSTDSGSGSGVKLESTSGDIKISGADLTSSGNSTHSEIVLVSNGNVYLEDSVLEAVSSIMITAEGNIYAERASLTTTKNNSPITFNLNGANSTLYMDGIEINTKNNNDSVVEPDGAQICGTVSSGLVDGSNSYTGGEYCTE